MYMYMYISDYLRILSHLNGFVTCRASTYVQWGVSISQVQKIGSLISVYMYMYNSSDTYKHYI